MRKYEVMYIICPDVEQETVEATAEKFQSVINNGGEVTKHEIKGKRRLAYEIDKFNDGVYVLVNFTAPAEVVKELDRLMKISDEVIRHLIVQDVVA